jgi:putative FmdB family regulatory protein
MPTYEYACTDCGHRIEIWQSFVDPSLSTCEICGGRLRKVYFPVGVVLKGSGFYKTDNRAKEPAATGAGSSKDGSAGGAKSDTSGSDGAKSETRSSGSSSKDTKDTKASSPAKEKSA